MRTHLLPTFLPVFILFVLTLTICPVSHAEDWTSQFVAPQDLRVDLFADESQVADPVALCLDDQGRVYVAEIEPQPSAGSRRIGAKTSGLTTTLALETVEDRLEMYRKWADKFEGGLGYFYQVFADQLRRLEDANGDGRADRCVGIFAGGLNHPLDGLAAGVIARTGRRLFCLRPKSLPIAGSTIRTVNPISVTFYITASAFGTPFIGHDLHGLVWGPDGKLYFLDGRSRLPCGCTKEGTICSTAPIAERRACAAMTDGSQLEVFATGLRNPAGTRLRPDLAISLPATTIPTLATTLAWCIYPREATAAGG